MRLPAGLSSQDLDRRAEAGGCRSRLDLHTGRYPIRTALSLAVRA